MKEFKVENHESSFLPEGREWELVWSDEFDGTELDTSKWSFRTNFWGEPFAAYTDKGVVLDGNSHVELHRTERDGYYVSPQLQTGENSFDVPEAGDTNPWGHTAFWPLGELSEAKFMHRFGYYECRCKMQKYPNEMWSAFWIQSPSIGTSYDPSWCGIESDIFEYQEQDRLTAGNIMGGYGTQFHEEGRIKDVPLEETEDGFHRFGLSWMPDGYEFYFDGKLISKATEYVSHIPQFILLTTEVHGYRLEKPLKVEGEFVDDAFIVDYVRVFDAK